MKTNEDSWRKAVKAAAVKDVYIRQRISKKDKINYDHQMVSVREQEELQRRSIEQL